MKGTIQKWKLVILLDALLFLSNMTFAKDTINQYTEGNPIDTTAVSISDKTNIPDRLYVDSLSLKRHFIHRIGIEARPGYIFPTSSFFRGENLNWKPIENSLSLHLKYSFQFHPNTYNDRIYRGAYQGIGVGYYNMYEKPQLGNPLTVYLFQGARIARFNQRLSLNYLNFGDYQIAGASPEMLVRVENGVVQTGPIAGTRPRGKTVEEDMALEKELLADKKEIAEHTMLVDLGRNDIGRVSEFGSVKVTRFKYVERFSHVMHIITDVEGKLRSDKTCFDALGSTLPAGTLSGAPKIRAMEIIDELEKTKRSTYGGAIGYISFNGNFDSCITIRTGVFKDGKAYIQAGGGIVYDSIPENEYQESINKASAVLRAIEEAGDIV